MYFHICTDESGYIKAELAECVSYLR